MCAFNVVLPWDFTSFGETFHTKEIALDSPKESPNLRLGNVKIDFFKTVIEV